MNETPVQKIMTEFDEEGGNGICEEINSEGRLMIFPCRDPLTGRTGMT
jgi:hypothetical protein